MNDVDSSGPDGFFIRLVDALRAAGLPTTQAGIGELVGVAQTAVSGWANDGAFPRMETLVRLGELTGCSLDWLVMGRGTPGGSTDGDQDLAALIRSFRALRLEGRAFVMQAARIALAAQGAASASR